MIVGLTGGVATGKSLIAGELKRLGAFIIDADTIGHELLEPAEAAYSEIVEEFGPGILSLDGRIDRPALGKIVFTDRSRLDRLNSITHPRIIEKIKKEIEVLSSRRPKPIIVVNAALLIESGHYREMDAVVVVDTAEAEQVRRSVERDGVEEAQVRSRIAAQMSAAEKAAHADIVIDNNGTVEEVLEKTRALYEELKRERRA